MAVNFDWDARAGILDAGCPESDREWIWFRNSTHITASCGGEITSTLAAPEGAKVNEIKAIIRQDAKRR